MVQCFLLGTTLVAFAIGGPAIIYTYMSSKGIILHLATTYQLFAHIGERKVPSFMMLSSPIIVLFFLNFLWHPFSIVALRFNLETIISPPLTEVLQVKKVVI